MSISDIRQQLEEILETLPENKLEAVLDFASYIKEAEQIEDFLKMQMGSSAYEDWLSSENDVYDEVFKNELEKG